MGSVLGRVGHAECGVAALAVVPVLEVLEDRVEELHSRLQRRVQIEGLG